MRKNSARKWLHFTLDLLPVIAIPVFMIYSHRHSLTERTNVEVNYKYETNEVSSLDDLVDGHIYQFDIFGYVGDENYTFEPGYFDVLYYDDFSVDYNDSSIDEVYRQSFDSSSTYVPILCENNFLTVYFTSNETYVCYIYEGIDFAFSNFVFVYSVDNSSSFMAWYCNTFNVLPSITDFNIIEGYSADTTNENILNVFYKDFTDTIDNYFNFDNVFTFGDIWQWFNTNMFGGNASPIAHAIYEIIVYEFIIDIMFLSYCVFMFIIDFTTDTLERFTGWSSRG